MASSGTARADQPEPEADAEVESTEVHIVGDRADSIQKIPGSITVIDKKEIERAHATDAAELLGRVPGLNVRQEAAGGGRFDVGVRGLDPGRSRRVLVLEDGVPLAINPYAEPDLYFGPQIFRVSRIEVLKGSGSILFGPQTIGGVINLVTLVPPYETEARAAVDVGLFGTARTLGRFGTAIPTGDTSDPVRVVGQVVVERGDGARAQPYAEHDALVKVAFPTGAVGQGTLKLAAHRTTAVSEDVGLTRGMFERDPRRPSLSPESRLGLSRLDASFTHELALGGAVTLTTLAYATYTTRVWNRQRYDRIPEAGTPYVRISGDVELPLGALYFRDASRVLDRSYWVGGLEPRLTARFATGDVDHKLDAGLRFLVEGASLDELDGGSARASDGLLVGHESHATRAFAAYVSDRLAFRPWLVVTPGVRLEVAHYARQVSLAEVASQTGAGDSESVAVVPGLGLTAGAPEAHAFAGAHVGYAPPRLTTAISDQGQNQVLDPEQSTSYELGVRLRPEPFISGELTGWFQRFANQIVPSASPGSVTELVNGGATLSGGVDAAATLRAGAAAELPLEVDLGVRGGVLRSVFSGGDLDGKSLPYAPTFTISATLDVETRFGLAGEVAVRVVGSQYADDQNTVLPDATGRVGLIDAYTLLDANLSYAIAETGVAVSLVGKSLLNQPFVIARRPEGIAPAGFAELGAGLRYAVR